MATLRQIEQREGGVAQDEGLLRERHLSTHPVDARTPEQFKAIDQVCIDKWTEDGEYASWSEENYITAPWDTWFAGVAGDIAGILPSQNPIEAFHRVIKKSTVSTLRASTATVLNRTLPKILRLAGQEWSSA